MIAPLFVGQQIVDSEITRLVTPRWLPFPIPFGVRRDLIFPITSMLWLGSTIAILSSAAFLLDEMDMFPILLANIVILLISIAYFACIMVAAIPMGQGQKLQKHTEIVHALFFVCVFINGFACYRFLFG